MSRTLYQISSSPWSEKARWALDHHGMKYTSVEHLPLLGEPFLRLRTGRLTGRISVPFLVDDELRMADSFEIARHADLRGGGSSLFPEADFEALKRWNETSEGMLAAGRALATARAMADSEARREALPANIPNSMRGWLTPMADLGAAFLTRKYGYGDWSVEACTQRLADGLADLDRATDSGRGTVMESGFCYADIAMAVALQFVAPVNEAYIHLGPASRRCWSQPALAERFAAVVAWRDRTYSERRRPQPV